MDEPTKKTGRDEPDGAAPQKGNPDEEKTLIAPTVGAPSVEGPDVGSLGTEKFTRKHLTAATSAFDETEEVTALTKPGDGDATQKVEPSGTSAAEDTVAEPTQQAGIGSDSAPSWSESTLPPGAIPPVPPQPPYGAAPGYPQAPGFGPTPGYGAPPPGAYPPYGPAVGGAPPYGPPPPGFAPPRPPRPPRQPVVSDPLAIGLANASFLGVGYLLMRRWVYVAISLVGTAALVTVLCTVASTEWFEMVVVAWWLAMIGHGWHLAGGTKRTVVRNQWVVAVAVTLPVLLVVGFFRVDAVGIDRSLMAARDTGDCAAAAAAGDRLWGAQYVAGAPVAARAEATADVCGRLDAAAADLTGSLSGGDVARLQAGYQQFDDVLAAGSGHDRMVETTMNGFLDELRVSDACTTAKVTGWLHGRAPNGTLVDQSRDVGEQLRPDSLVNCGDSSMTASQFEGARDSYRSLLDEYPGHALTPRAQEGVTKANQAIELANVRDLLSRPGTGGQPAYCANPANYSAAGPVAPGANRAVLAGDTRLAGRMPAEWKAGDAGEAVIVVCLGNEGEGAPVRTCPYRNDAGKVGNVTFHNITVPVKAFELRTGNVVYDGQVEIGGASCPQSFISTGQNGEVPARWPVEPSDANIRDAFAPVINR